MENNGIVSVWAVCGFTEDELEEYTEYDYDNDRPSRFCLDNGVNDEDIDEDFMESAVRENAVSTAEELLADCSYYDSFIAEFSGKTLPENCNGAILVYNYEYDGNKVENARVVFLGTAEYDL
ncbi:MAG: immunity 22 family protein [Ruminococcus sp.]|nr:immunity 22 family protein [Ruminococcus sp.]